jgi:hypothetical protein
MLRLTLFFAFIGGGFLYLGLRNHNMQYRKIGVVLLAVSMAMLVLGKNVNLEFMPPKR